MRGGLSEAWASYRDRLLRRCGFCGEWSYDQDDCAVCGVPAVNHPRPVREFRCQTSREYRDLLDIAQAASEDDSEERTA